MAGRKASEWDETANAAAAPLFEEWDDSQLEDLDKWSLEDAIGGAAPQRGPPPDRDFGNFVETLDERLADDIGYGSAKENIEILSRMYIQDKANYARAEQILRRHKLLRLVQAAVRARARQLSNVQAVPGGGEALALVRIKDEFPEAPVHPDAVVPVSWILDGSADGPRRYRLTKRNVKKRDGEYYEELVGVAYNPLVITATMIDIADAAANLALAWKTKGKWRHKVVPRQKILLTRDLVECLGATHGFPANANNARAIISYLADYEAFNEEVIPTRPMTTQMGWQKDGALGFVAGRTHIKASADQHDVHFVGLDDGEEQLAKCATERGTFDGWAAAAKIAANFPLVELSIYASLAPPLLTPLRASNFTVDWSHKTSAGKTTTLSLAASCWGNPDPNGHDSLIASWDMTPVGFERRASAMSCMPLIVDDTKRARSFRGESVIPGIVYEVSNGQGRIRGSVKGTAKTSYWRTVMLSTGEQRIIDFDKSGGTPARVVTLWGNPFNGTSSVIGRAIRRMKCGIAENYGHAGPAFVEWLMRMKPDWADLRAEHEERTIDIENKMLAIAAGRTMDMSVIGRVATYLATLQMAAECAHEALALPWRLDDPIGKLLGIIVPAAGVVDREVEALRAAVSWATANQGKFCHNESSRRDNEPAGGWLGFWEASMFDNWDRLAFFPTAIRDFLSRQGFEPQTTMRQWQEAGWLEISPNEKRLTARIPELSGRPRMVVLKREAVTNYGGLDGPAAMRQAGLPFDSGGEGEPEPQF